jgi:uncharacterized SAM-binding protein YcdF (DUF218 family)
VAVLVLGVARDATAGPLSDWLSPEHPLEPCLAIVALNGDQPARADEAARLHQRGIGVEVWLTSDPRSGADGRSDEGTRSNARRLLSHGIPNAAIHLVPGAATSTRAELAAIAAELRARAVPCAVLVTSPLHARRVMVTWQRVVGAAPRAVVRHAPNAQYRGGWRLEVKELTLTFLAWLGLPR